MQKFRPTAQQMDPGIKTVIGFTAHAGIKHLPHEGGIAA